jgi:hypothetical protein
VIDIIAVGKEDILLIKVESDEFDCKKDVKRLFALPSLPGVHKALFIRRKGRNNGWKIIAVRGTNPSGGGIFYAKEISPKTSRKAWLRSLGITLDSVFTD